jgi:hypothetical protein
MNFINSNRRNYSFILNILCLFALTVCAAHAQSLVNGDFEGPFLQVTVPPGSNSGAKIDGSVATGWRDESAWGNVSITYSQDPTGGRNNTSAQKIEVHAITQGAAQFVQELKFNSGSTYHVTAWVKAAAPGTATLMLRRSGTPYTTYGSTKINLTTEWQKVDVSGKADSADNGLIMFIPDAPGTYWIDDVDFKVGA